MILNACKSVNQKHVDDFYKSYDLWLRSGAPHSLPYSRAMGLCGNLNRYMDAQDELFSRQLVGSRSAANRLMGDQFIEAGLDRTVPFNRDESGHDVLSFCAESDKGECYLNRERIKWVIEKVREIALRDENKGL